MSSDPYHPRTLSTIGRLCRVAWLILPLLAVSFISNSVVATRSFIPQGFSSSMIEVKFREGADVDVEKIKTALPKHLANAISHSSKIFSLPKDKLDNVRKTGERHSRKKLTDLNLWFRINLKPGTNAVAFLDELRHLQNIESAEPAPLPQRPPAITPNFTARQSYLNAAPGGIDARFDWTIPGGNGSGVTIYDVEYSWNQTHEDLSKVHGLPLLLDPGDLAVDYFNDNNHGTAVLGELVADNDTKGVTGIAWGANVGLAPAYTAKLFYDPANAILLAVAHGSPGDVILLEQQTPVCNLPDESFGPIEWIPSVFDAIETAVANRFVVVEAAGNGNVNLDQPACGNTFNRTIRDSGAIIVGAGLPPIAGVDRQRAPFSSYGSRVDLQGWGAHVQTTGYGAMDQTGYTNPDDPTNPNFWYTPIFSGTSSASPIVAGAVANLQGIAIKRFGTPLTPFEMRQLLVETGSPQLGTTSEHIGPLPNLKTAFSLITEPAVDIFLLVDLSGSFFDDIVNFKTQAPSMISTLRASNPNTRFGLASFEDYPIPPFGNAAAGDAAYRRNIDLTFDTAAVKSVINGLTLRSGADGPQSQLPALYQAATGAGQDLSGTGFPAASIPAGQQANFRPGATKLFLLWTDAPFHLPGDPGTILYPGPSFVATAAAILALDPPQVVGISSGNAGLTDLQTIAAATNAFAPPGGIDCNNDGVIDLLEGQPLVCMTDFSGAGIDAAIIAIVEAAQPVAISVAIKPDGDPNCIQPKSRGVVPVAVLGSSIDVTTINLGTIQIDDYGDPATPGVAPQRSSFEDVDGNGTMDLVLKFRTQELNSAALLVNGNNLFITGTLMNGRSFRGSDFIFLAGGSNCLK